MPGVLDMRNACLPTLNVVADMLCARHASVVVH